MNNTKKIKISLAINTLIVLLTLTATIVMFNGINFMHETKPLLASTKLEMFKFFTVDSNLLMGIISIAFIIQEINYLKGKIKIISENLYRLKLSATTAVTLTFVVTFGYLSFIAEGGIKVLLMNSNLFYHLIVPVLSMITFMFFEKTNRLNFKDTLFGLIPTLVYGSFYTTNILIHAENLKVSPKYDWYYFVQNGICTTVIVIPILFIITYIISLILWKVNKENR